jgi:hypothetical protein
MTRGEHLVRSISRLEQGKEGRAWLMAWPYRQGAVGRRVQDCRTPECQSAFKFDPAYCLI